MTPGLLEATEPGGEGASDSSSDPSDNLLNIGVRFGDFCCPRTPRGGVVKMGEVNLLSLELGILK